MDFEFDAMMGIDKLALDFEAHVVGFDGECFMYSVYFNNAINEEDFVAVKESVGSFAGEAENNGDYVGYIDVTNEGDKIRIYLDLGNVEPENTEASFCGVLTALNKVSGIEKVLINEDSGFEF